MARNFLMQQAEDRSRLKRLERRNSPKQGVEFYRGTAAQRGAFPTSRLRIRDRWIEEPSGEEFIWSGSTWLSTDTGWIDITTSLVVANRGTLFYRRQVNRVDLALATVGGHAINTTVVGTLPAAIRPTVAQVRGPVSLTGGYTGFLNIQTDGSIIIGQQTGASRANAGSYVSYLLG